MVYSLDRMTASGDVITTVTLRSGLDNLISDSSAVRFELKASDERKGEQSH